MTERSPHKIQPPIIRSESIKTKKTPTKSWLEFDQQFKHVEKQMKEQEEKHRIEVEENENTQKCFF